MGGVCSPSRWRGGGRSGRGRSRSPRSLRAGTSASPSRKALFRPARRERAFQSLDGLPDRPMRITVRQPRTIADFHPSSGSGLRPSALRRAQGVSAVCSGRPGGDRHATDDRRSPVVPGWPRSWRRRHMCLGSRWPSCRDADPVTSARDCDRVNSDAVGVDAAGAGPGFCCAIPADAEYAVIGARRARWRSRADGIVEVTEHEPDAVTDEVRSWRQRRRVNDVRRV